MEVKNKIIVAFHVGRGGRFHNAGHKTFIGEMDFQELISRNDSNLYKQNRDRNGRFCKPYFTGAGGNIVDASEDIRGEVGYLNFDGQYDTDSCEYLDNCSEEELRIIINSGRYVSNDLNEHLTKITN